MVGSIATLMIQIIDNIGWNGAVRSARDTAWFPVFDVFKMMLVVVFSIYCVVIDVIINIAVIV